jgi:hypothetical protein
VVTSAQISAAAQAVYYCILPDGDALAVLIAQAPWLLDDATLDAHRARVLAICTDIARVALQAAEAVTP